MRLSKSGSRTGVTSPMPRPNRNRTIGAEDNMRAYIREALERDERSTAWLARKMTDAGCAIDASAVWKTLNAGRSIYVDEGVAIAAALNVGLDEMTLLLD